MAKKRTVVVGSVCKGKVDGDGNRKPDYISIANDVTLKKGQFLNLESKEEQQKRLTASIKSGKLTGKYAEDIQKRIDRIPDFVRFNIVYLEDVGDE